MNLLSLIRLWLDTNYRITTKMLQYSFKKNRQLRACLGLLRSTFFSSALYFLAKRFQLHALCSRKKGGVVRAPKEVLHKLQFFMELLHGRVCRAEWNSPKHPLNKSLVTEAKRFLQCVPAVRSHVTPAARLACLTPSPHSLSWSLFSH